MMKIALILACLPSLLFAAEIYQDGFGFFREEGGERSTWAGAVLSCEEDQCETRTQSAGELAKIEFYLGQKSQRAGHETFMALGVFEDEFGNLRHEGEGEIQVDSGARNTKVKVEKGIGVTTFNALDKAGYYSGSIAAEGIQSARELYRVIPDLNSIRPSIDLPENTAKQGSVMTIRTGEMNDQYGNEAPIGTTLHGMFDGEDGSTNLLIMTSQGRYAESVIATSRLQGDYNLKLDIRSQYSEAQGFEIIPENLTQITFVRSEYDPQAQIIFIALDGIQTKTGNLIQDGLPLKLKIQEANGETQMHEVWSRNGGVSLQISISPMAFPIQGEIMGDYGELDFVIAGENGGEG